MMPRVGRRGGRAEAIDGLVDAGAVRHFARNAARRSGDGANAHSPKQRSAPGGPEPSTSARAPEPRLSGRSGLRDAVEGERTVVSLDADSDPLARLLQGWRT